MVFDTVVGCNALWYVRRRALHFDVANPLSRVFVVFTQAIREVNSLLHGHISNTISDSMLLKGLGVDLKPTKAPKILEAF